MSDRLNEAGPKGSIDAVDSQLTKAMASVQKAQDAVLDAADELDAVMVNSVAVGGKIAQIIPSHIKVHIAKLTDIADKQLGSILAREDNEEQDLRLRENVSTLGELQNFLDSIPYGDIKPETPKERRDKISLSPNLSDGPQSQVADKSPPPPKAEEALSLEDYYRSSLKEDAHQAYSDNSFSFNKLRESEIFGHKYETDMMDAVNIKMAAPLQVKQVREQLRAAADEVMFEDVDEADRSKEKLKEGSILSGMLRAFGGNDGMPLKFDSLSSGGHIVPGGIK